MRVLVTRPEPGASRTASRVAALGHEPLLLPLTRIEPLVVEIAVSPDIDAVIATSANAFRHAPGDLLRRVVDLPCFVVGRGTAAAAADAGCKHVEDAGGDASSLAGLVRDRLSRDSPVLYLCGRLRRPTLERALADAGFHVEPVEIYDTLPLDYDPGDVAAHLGSGPVAVVMLFSVEAALAFLRLVKSVPAPALAGRPRVICISRRVAAAVAGHDFQTMIAAEPTEASMLSALDEVPQVSQP